MWKLKIAEGEDPWLRSTNNFFGRQIWEFHPHLGSHEERAEIEKARDEFWKNRFQLKHSSDLLMRMQVISLYITGALNTILSAEHRKEIRRYIYNHQNADGGWGLHIEGHSIMFSSVLFYVVLRLLGEDGGDAKGDVAMEKARRWVLDRGGATYIPSWGKLWLSILGVFDWSGNNPMPPEMWLSPYSLPFHPGRTWCHCRLVYLPMSYLYGKKFVGPITETVLSLRNELYTCPYSNVDWNQARNLCAKVLNMLCSWVENPNSEAFKLHLPRLYDYLWVAEDGMKMKGSDGSQLWDTALAVQAIVSCNLVDQYSLVLKKAHKYIKMSQVLENCAGDFRLWYRHISKGAWTLTTADNGWQVSDCTGGLKVALLLSKLPPEIVGEPLTKDRFYDSVNVILSLQAC